MANDIALPQQPNRIGQATAVEQSRAVAEVHAAILVAQQCPRDVPAAIGQMRQSCQMKALADRAFFRFSRGGTTVSGASVHLARELARCWGNIQYGVAEMSRDDEHGQSEMLAYAWDVQTNARASTVFIVPHKRDKRTGPERLTDMRDIYENNANAGARRVRECIFGVLPPWFVEEAKELCTKTIIDGGGKPLAQRIADALAMFADIGVTQDDIARKLDRPAGKWTAHDVAQLGVVYTSIQRGEVTRDEEFPPLVVTREEITAAAPKAEPTPIEGPAVDEPVDEPAVEEPAVESVGDADTPANDRAPDELIRKIRKQLTTIGVEPATERVYVLQKITRRPLRNTSDITTQEGALIADILTSALAADDPGRALDQVLAERDEEATGG